MKGGGAAGILFLTLIANASVERLFNVGGHVCTKNRGRLSDENLDFPTAA